MAGLAGPSRGAQSGGTPWPLVPLRPGARKRLKLRGAWPRGKGQGQAVPSPVGPSGEGTPEAVLGTGPGGRAPCKARVRALPQDPRYER